MVIDDPLDPLTNLRFADDVLLIACSKGDVIKMISDLGREAGFVLVSESDILDNPGDDLNASVFDEAVRGRTDQFLMKFEKPAGAPQ